MLDVHVFDRTDARLGRHQLHDPRSRAFAIEAGALPKTPVMHARHAPIFDQGEIGSCTANAALGCLVTGPLFTGKVFDEDDAVALYKDETRLDDSQIPGHYPPDDTGSTGLWSAKALRQKGLIRSYWHAFSTDAVLSKVAQQPVSIGVPWLNSMFEPSASGLVPVRLTSGVAGGHQVCLDGIDPQKRVVRFANSWGAGWGSQGYGYLTYADLDFLLRQGGDATAFVL